MDTKDFVTRLMVILRKRSKEYQAMSKRQPTGSLEEIVEEKATARALDEVADCIVETLATFNK